MDPNLDVLSLGLIVLLGLFAGSLGGMLGIGGSIVMIPGLTVILGRDQHLYQAAAMIANVAVSIPAARRHRRAGAIDFRVLKWMLPGALFFILLGVWVSNREIFRGNQGGIWLGRLLAGFLMYVLAVNIRRLISVRSVSEPTEPHLSPAGCMTAGAAMGTVGGLLGVGGGTVAVPLQQILVGLPLRVCIANSTAVICFTAAIGAVYKNATLAQHGHSWTHSLVLAGLLGPSCWIGGHLGAAMTHRLPLRQVRVAFMVLMFLAALKMAAIPWPASPP